VEQILIAVDEESKPVDLTDCIPYAQVRNDPNGPVILDLDPSLITPGALAGAVTVDPSEDLFTLASHGLKAGMCVQFSTTGVLPSPLSADDFYVVMGEGLTTDDFKVMTLEDALILNTVSVNLLTSGTGTLNVAIAQGQILIPEIADTDTEGMDEAPAAGWDLMIEDSLGRRLAPFITGEFPISRGFTDPAYLT
jgi:hypothetical protein